MKHKLVSLNIVCVLAGCLAFYIQQAEARWAKQAAEDVLLYLPVIVKDGNDDTTPQPEPQPGRCLTEEEFKLANLVNAYRQEEGLPAVPVSRSLTKVAQLHVLDLHENNPNSGTDPRGKACNLHSWSDKGAWSAVCYTSDHHYASKMWSKPREITQGIYPGNGYEISYGAAGFTISAEAALAAWKQNSGHKEVILEQDIWSRFSSWPAMGIGLHEGYAVVWFGDNKDPEGVVSACSQ